MEKLDILCLKMMEWNNKDPKRIQHFLKVHSFARLIGHGEKLNADLQEIVEAAAMVHDIGIRPAEEKCGKENGKLQEQEGPKPAKQLVLASGYTQEQAERIAYLVGHHHTYDNIDGLDYQILVEADFLVNFYESNTPIETIKKTLEKIFQTKTGIQICKTQFGC